MMGIASVLDLLQHYPRRYLDRTRTRSTSPSSRSGEEATVFAEVQQDQRRGARGSGRAIVEAVVYDGTSYLNVTFFNQAWRERQLARRHRGRVLRQARVYRGKRQMTNPVVDVLGQRRARRPA